MAESLSTGAQQHKGKQGNGSATDSEFMAGAAGLMDQVKSRATSQIHVQQGRAADGLGTVAGALRKAGDELRPQNESLAYYADMAVDELEHLSRRIRDKEPGEYLADVEHFARRRPAAFVGGAFLLGLAAARFLKSTEPRTARRAGNHDTPDYGGGNGAFRGVRSGEFPRQSTGGMTPPAPGYTPTPFGNATAAGTGGFNAPGSPSSGGLGTSAPNPGTGNSPKSTSSTPRSPLEGGHRDPE